MEQKGKIFLFLPTLRSENVAILPLFLLLVSLLQMMFSTIKKIHKHRIKYISLKVIKKECLLALYLNIKLPMRAFR